MSFACYLNLRLPAFVRAFWSRADSNSDKLLLSCSSTVAVWINTSLGGRPRCCDAMAVAGGVWWRFGIQCPLVKYVPHKDRKTFIWYHRHPENICPNPSLSLDINPKRERFLYFWNASKLLWVRYLVSRSDRKKTESGYKPWGAHGGTRITVVCKVTSFQKKIRQRWR